MKRPDTDEMEQMKMALKLACTEIGEMTGTCPLGQFELGEWYKEDCESVCSDVTLDQCWGEYYLEKAKQKLKKE